MNYKFLHFHWISIYVQDLEGCRIDEWMNFDQVVEIPAIAGCADSQEEIQGGPKPDSENAMINFVDRGRVREIKNWLLSSASECIEA